MEILNAYCLMITSTFIIDVLLRWALDRPRHDHEMKPAGLVALIILSLREKHRRYAYRTVVIKQYFLSLAIVIFMGLANYFLLTRGVPKNTDVLGFALVVTPIITMPFFHFLYSLIGIQPLDVDDTLMKFRLRGAIAIILSANVTFIALESLQHILALFIHFCLALFALVGIFFLSAHQRKRASIYHAPFQNIEYGVAPMMLHHLAAILEVFYFVLLIAEVFLKNAILLWLAPPVDIGNFLITVGSLLAFAALFTKIRTLFGPVISLAFYEEKALPMSFLIFGVTSVIRYFL